MTAENADKTRGGCHPRCTLGPRADHPGYLAYRCITDAVETLPWLGEDGYDESLVTSPETSSDGGA